MKNPAAGGGRWVDVSPERLVSWIVTFTQRHGPGSVWRDESGTAVTFTAADGAAAECHPPFPPLSPAARPDPGPAAAAAAMAAHAMADRTVGVLLVRLGGYAVGVFAGSPPQLENSKVGSPARPRPQRRGRLVSAPLRAQAGEPGRDRHPRRRGRRGPDLRSLRPGRPGPGRGQAVGGGAARRSAAGAVPGARDRPVPHRSPPAAGRAEGNADRLRGHPHPPDRAGIRYAAVSRSRTMDAVLPTTD